MNTNTLKQNAIHSASKLSLAVAASLLVMLSLAAQAAAQSIAAQSCPNVRTFGARPNGIRADGETRRVQAVYFRTDDKNAFIPETSDRRWSSSTVKVNSDDFRGRLGQLVAQGAAEVNSRRTGALFMGDTASLDRGPQALNQQNASYFDLATPMLTTARVRSLDRYTTFSVFQRRDEDFYRVGLLSWFVDIRPDGGGRMTVDIDAGMFLRPGETQVIKFLSDYEVGRTGSARTHLALTLVPLADGDEEQTAQVSASRR
jgi:hypothetical protein